MIKSVSKDVFTLLKCKIIFQVNVVLLNFRIITKSWGRKSIIFSHKYNSKTIFNINNENIIISQSTKYIILQNWAY